jgi:uncharacterized protein YjbI with pentapeptide repeats
MVAQPITRDDEIKAIHEKYKTFYQILGRTFLVGLGIFIGLIWFSADLDRSAYIVNLFTTFLGTLAAVLIIDFLNRRRELCQLKAQLIRDAGSAANDFAKNAIHQLWKQEWLRESTGLLRGANLSYANLEGVDFFHANLQGADLSVANLSEANLIGTNLERANLYEANLQNAQIMVASLQDADLVKANLEGADLEAANLARAQLVVAKLQGANLFYANLKGANLRLAKLDGALILLKQPGRSLYTRFDTNTILPDGSHWTPDTDLTQFGCIVE